MKQKTSQTLYPAFGFLVVVIVAVAAVATAYYQRNAGTVAPNAADQTKADYTVNSCRIDFEARALSTPTPTPCTPINNLVDVSISLDVSGSMVGPVADQTNSKLAKAKAAIRAFTNQVLTDDPQIAGKVRLGLTRFGTCNNTALDNRPAPNNPDVVWPQTKILSELVNNTGRQAVLNQLNAITIPFKDSNGNEIWDLNRTCTPEGITLANNVLRRERAGTTIKPKKYLIVVTDGRPFSEKFKNTLEIMDDETIKANSAILQNSATSDTQIITVGVGDMGGGANPGFKNILMCMAGELDSWTIYKRSQGQVSNDVYKVVNCIGNANRKNPGKYYLAQNPDDIAPVFNEIYNYITDTQCIPNDPTVVNLRRIVR